MSLKINVSTLSNTSGWLTVLMKQLDVEVSTPAKDFRYDSQLVKTGSKTCRLTTSPHILD